MVYKYIELSDTMTYSNGYKDGYKEGYNSAIEKIIVNPEREI